LENLIKAAINFDVNQVYKNRHILVGDTEYGDGIFYDNLDRQYGVDSGTIGIIPYELIEKNKYDHIKKKNLANIVIFKDDFVAKIENGIFTLGNVVIDTCCSGNFS